MWLQDAKPSDVNEILLLDGHNGVLEGMSSNVFVVQDGKVITPDKGILVGTVRNLVLEVGDFLVHTVERFDEFVVLQLQDMCMCGTAPLHFVSANAGVPARGSSNIICGSQGL